MKAPVVVVGSGASGVHFAQTALEMGRNVLMVDVGREGPLPERPGDDLNSLKRNLADPVAYFLGSGFESLILPSNKAEYYGFPPNKKHVFSPHRQFRYQARGFAPLVSFAAGGLAEAWTGGCYPFREEELADFPFGYRELGPYYGETARRIGVTGASDDLAAFFPVHDGLQEPLRLDEHSERLLGAYTQRREKLNGDLSCFIGRSRSAVLSRELNGRKACDYSGRCLWGCPSQSLYTPLVTLRECLRHPGFQYLRGYYASHFRFTTGGIVRSLIASSLDGTEREIPAENLVLAAGALSSAGIFLESIYRDSGERVRLRGLMDNRQVLMPFVNISLLGRKFNPENYQYHQLAMGITGPTAADYVHGLVTTLKTALVHPIAQNLPFDLGTSTSLFRNLHAALGLVNINFSDFRREDNYVELEPESESRLAIQYQPDRAEPEKIAEARKRFRKVLWALGCVAPPPMTHIRPMGASVHYAGMIPMTRESAPLHCSPSCRSYDFSNLFFADGITFPSLPAKNLTFTLMANAIRVAREIGP